jgi:Uma2 family endonuclease
MAQIKTRIGMPLDEWMRRYDEEGAFELIDGEVIPVHPPKFGHSNLSNTLAFRINSLTLPKKLGEAFVETAFVLPDNAESDWVKGSCIPDVMFVTTQRLADYKAQTPDWADRPLAIVPDLAVEIISANDHYTDVNRKVAGYLKDGVKLVWVFDPKQKTVAIYSAGSKISTTLSENDTLSGGELIPGLELSIKELFN